MSEADIHVYIKKEIKEISKLSRKINADFSAADIHDFRVAIKCLRSLLRMLKLAGDDGHIGLTTNLKRLYHVAGTIRDTTLDLQYLKDNGIDIPHYADKQLKLRYRQKAEWEKYYSKDTFRRLKDRVLAADLSLLRHDMPLTFICGKLTAIADLSAIKSPTDNQFHLIRKEIKDIIYLYGIVKKNWAQAYALLAQLPFDEFSELATEFGAYNDKRILLERLSSFSSPAMMHDERKTIIEFCTELTAGLKTDKRLLLQHTRRLIQSLPPELAGGRGPVADAAENGP